MRNGKKNAKNTKNTKNSKHTKNRHHGHQGKTQAQQKNKKTQSAFKKNGSGCYPYRDDHHSRSFVKGMCKSRQNNQERRISTGTHRKYC